MNQSDMQEVQQEQVQQEQVQRCAAAGYGVCDGSLLEHAAVWHVRPRMKDLAKGCGINETTLPVVLCSHHYKRITDQYSNGDKLPTMYGWDEADALDGLIGCHLEYTGLHPSYCAFCVCRQKTTISETGTCTKACQSLFALDPKWPHCYCQRPVYCICEKFNNNALHWAVLTYVNGLDYTVYTCPACVRPSWRDTNEYYKAGLVPIKTILALAAQQPECLLQRNSLGETPLTLIQPMLESLQMTIEGEYLKCAEYGCAKANMAALAEIKKVENPCIPGKPKGGKQYFRDYYRSHNAGIMIKCPCCNVLYPDGSINIPTFAKMNM